NPDLLWASRGGGGGNFGIVTQLRYRTQPARSMGFFLLGFAWADAVSVLRGWASRMHSAPGSVWANLHLEASGGGSPQVRIVGVCRAGQEDREAAAMEASVGSAPTSTSTFTTTFLGGVQYLGGGTTSPRQGWAAGSDVITGMPLRQARALMHLVSQPAASQLAVAVILDPLTGAVQSRSPGATAFAWRRQLASIQWYLSLPDHPSLAQIHTAYGWIATAHQAVAGQSVGGYVNYLEPRRHVASYYGPNFTRLRQIKAAYDQHGFFAAPYSIP
ncbi:MAG: BBE domain-containing protein, partial [Streptosporangiaceae bacterium]